MTLFYAEMLEMLGHGKVIAVDQEVRTHNKTRIYCSKVADRIQIVEGDSASLFTSKEVFSHIPYGAKVLVSLDSNHTAQHVKMEMDLYSTLVQPGGYLIVFDTVIEMVMKEKPADRPWGPGNNPYQAVGRWLAEHLNWEPDHDLTARALITAAPGGWLRRIR
jgi:cephalosporin hydroxylase